MGEDVERGRLWAAEELKGRGRVLGGGKVGTGVLGGTEGSAGLSGGSKKPTPLLLQLDGEGAPQEELME